MKTDVDVAIVGGGPAGSSTALHLTRVCGIRADRVAILERATHPREKPCAGAVSGWGVDALSAIGVAIDVPRVTMRGLRVIADGCSAEHASPSLGVVIRRNEFDAMLFRTAAADGVRASDGEAVTAIDRLPFGFRLHTTKRALTARLVAACDGAGSAVRKLFGVREAARKGHLYVLETPPERADEGAARGVCDFDLTPCDRGLEGYYWDFPTVIDGARVVSRGIYHANFTASREVKRELSRQLALRGVDIERQTLKPFSTRPLVPNAPTWLRGLLLVGEAAGIDRTTGEGIAQAILMGEIAARHLARALRTDATSFEGYAHELARSRVGRHLLQSAWLAERVYGRRGAGWRRFLARSPIAVAAGTEWYEGRPVGAMKKARLAIGLARELALSS